MKNVSRWFQQKPIPQLSMFCLIQGINDYVQINTFEVIYIVVRICIFINLASNILLLASKKCFLTSQGLVGAGLNCRTLYSSLVVNIYLLISDIFIGMPSTRLEGIHQKILDEHMQYLVAELTIKVYFFSSIMCSRITYAILLNFSFPNTNVPEIFVIMYYHWCHLCIFVSKPPCDQICVWTVYAN